ncbi:MAG: AAA family ATPase [Saprospiraceae bacterium]|nr:AAA family ATPase [Candidatus Brachybacter algidus]
MLQRIKVKNYAIIDELTIDFNPHFNIITGETGAGKSILLGALGLILGNRADSKTFFNKEEKCIVEADFQIKEYDMKSWFTENDLDYEDLTIIRREIQPAGKNRVFINDTPVTLQQLQDLTQQLVDIHQQFSLYDIQKPAYQLTLFDAYAGNKLLSAEYGEKYKKLNGLNKELKELEERKLKSIQEADYLTFQLNELNAVPFESMDQAAMEDELNLIENAETIRTTSGAAYLALYENDINIISALDDIISNFSPIAKVSTTISEIYDRLHSSKIELQELSQDINHLAESTEIDEERAVAIKETLDQLYKLQSKHQVKDVAALTTLKEDLESKLQNFDELDDAIAAIHLDLKALEKCCLNWQISFQRHERNTSSLLQKLCTSCSVNWECLMRSLLSK